MSDLISRTKLINFIKANGFVYANTLETFPAVDAVAVVRCTDCKYARRDGVTSYTGLRCCVGPIAQAVPDEHYCGYGERRKAKP